MSMMDKLWDAFSTVIKMNDKVIAQAAAMAAQQAKIEDLTARVIRLETALEIAPSTRGPGGKKRLPRHGRDDSTLLADSLYRHRRHRHVHGHREMTSHLR